MNQTLLYLRAIDALIPEEKNWTKSVFARDGNGRRITPLSSKAECFCLSGAMRRINYLEDVDIRVMIEARSLILKNGGSESNSLPVFNDRSTFDEVKAAIAKSIAEIESRDKLSLACVARKTPMKGEADG